MPKRPRRPHATPPEEALSPEFRTVNEVVAHNLARARRAKGWTQAEAAERLHRESGKVWTAATLGAAERTASSSPGSRNRRFDADELLTFSLVFHQPIAYFFLPPDVEGKEIALYSHTQIDGNPPFPGTVSQFDLLECAIPLRFSAEVVDGVNRIMRKRDQVWMPGRADIDWYRPEEWKEHPRSPEDESADEEEERRERYERSVYEYQQEVARRAEAKLSSEEFGSLLRVHSSEVAKLLADEMASRGIWPRREVPSEGRTHPESGGIPESPGSGSGDGWGKFPKDPPF